MPLQQLPGWQIGLFQTVHWAPLGLGRTLITLAWSSSLGVGTFGQFHLL